MQRLPVPVIVALAVLLPIGPVLAVVTRGHAKPRAVTGAPLSAVAASAGCQLREFRSDMDDTNPPVQGRFVERISARDGSYAGRRPPSVEATIHALYHGRVLLQYRRDLPAAQVNAFATLVRDGDEEVMLFENQTGMQAAVAATAYLSVMTCPRVDRRTLHALDVFRDRRRGFGQAF
jgi:uncharacterized protein DUF3105